MGKIQEIIQDMDRDHEYLMSGLNEKDEKIGDLLDEYEIIDYYAGDIKIRVDSMDELNNVFKILMRVGFGKPIPRVPEFGTKTATFTWLVEGIYICLDVPIDNIPPELVGSCVIKEVLVEASIMPAHKKTIMVCEKD